MNDIIIRKAKREDCKIIRNLIQELAEFQGMPEGPKIDYTVLEKDGFDTEPPLFMCYVAEDNKNIVGYTFSYYTYSTWRGKAMFLEDLYVKPSYRNKYVGTKLVKAVATEATKNECCKLDFEVLDWNPAESFYKKLGAANLTEEIGLRHFYFSNTALKNLASDA